MNRLDEIRARHRRNEAGTHFMNIGRPDCNHMLIDAHEDRAYLLSLIERIEALPGSWMKSAGADHADTHILSDEGFMTIIECAAELTEILNED